MIKIYSNLLPQSLLCFLVLVCLSAQGADIDDVFKANSKINSSARASQDRIDKLADEADSLAFQFKQVSKQVDGLKVYNKQLENQIVKQTKQIDKIKQSISDVTIVERQITPLIMKMVSSLEMFVELDVPFLLQERKERISRLKADIGRTDITVADKYRRTVEAYQVENEYGRTLESYRDTINIGGTAREVNVLRIGRVSLLFQTIDGTLSGIWHTSKKQWQVLQDQRMNSYIKRGLQMASNQIAPDMMLLPISVKQ